MSFIFAIIFGIVNRILILFFLKVIGIASVNGQTTSTQLHTWYMYFGNHRLSDKIGIHSEYQWRRYGWGLSWQQSLMRIGLDYYFRKKEATEMISTTGYGWIISYPYGDQPVADTFHEHRIWEQFALGQRYGRFLLNHRYRFEQRNIQNKTMDANYAFVHSGWKFRQRARYRFLITIPVSRSEMKNNTFFISLYDEVFLGFGKGTSKNVLDQNRFYLAAGWRFNKNLNAHVGYLNQYLFKSDGVSAERNHTLQLSITGNFIKTD